MLKPGEGVEWTVYDGDNILDAKSIEDYVNGFFRSGNMMPIPGFNFKLDIHSVQTEYEDENGIHRVVIEGIVRK